MSVASAVANGRTAAEALMTDACTIAHFTGRTTDATTGVTTDTYAAPFYTGKCKVQSRDVDPQNPEAGDAQYTVLRDRVDVPMSVVGVVKSDRIDMTASADDPDLIGVAFFVRAPFHKSHATARRLPVEETP